MKKMDELKNVLESKITRLKTDAEIFWEKRVMSKIDRQDLAEKYQKFWVKVNEVVQKYFNGNHENFYIAVVGVSGFLIAVLILIFGGSSGPGGGHGHGHGHAEGEHSENEEQSIELSEDARTLSKIELQTVKKMTIHRLVKLRGRVSVNRDRYTEISARYPGTVQNVMKTLGDSVNKGDVLARVESVAARAAFDVRSGISGIIVDRSVVRGVFVSDREPLFTVADLTTVWAELNASDTDFQSLKVGQKIKVTEVDTGKTTESSVSYVSPNVYEDTQSIVVRAVIDNKDRVWRPGSFIEAEISVEDKEVAAAIHVDAVQTLDNKPTIFVQHDDSFVAREVVLGTADRDYMEVISGAADGESYISSNSFIAKAELLKSTAEHQH